jgi:uncharacterized protein YndB with AHSA1/START domain
MAKFFLFSLLSVLSWGAIAEESLSLPPMNQLIQESSQARWDKSVEESIVIEAPLQEVWKYLSDSQQAKNWSVFFHHISPLPGISDGQPGSLRRCFKYQDETGGRWDEMTIQTIPNKKREIVTFNLQAFGHHFLLKNQYIFVRQLYQSLGTNQTLLTFQTQRSQKANIKTRISFGFSKSDVRDIFQKNLINIKSNLEFHQRIYPWKE